MGTRTEVRPRRSIVAVGEDVRVWTRAGHELTDRLPELAPLVDSCGGAAVVLDGELVAGQGRADDFYRLLPRVAARPRREPLTFVAFDVLAFDGPVIDQPYCRRRALREGLALRGPARCTVPRLHGTVADSLNVCAEHGVCALNGCWCLPPPGREETPGQPPPDTVLTV